ncbi:MAG: outer membrane protein assembly factor BamE [Methylococcaceae bacterium]|nr:outer membrane protein assembly factor BamE [Methylococcaceae bacterium]
MRNLYFSLSLRGNAFKRCLLSLLPARLDSIPRILVVAVSLPVVSCATIFDHLPGVYRLEVQQGNIVDQDMVDQLRPQMSKRQVLYIMGSPMVVDVFHQTRWDYIFSEQKSGEDRVQKRISLYFNNDQLSGIQGDFRPGTQSALKISTETTVDVPKRDLDRTLWEKITGLVSYDSDDDDAAKKEKAEEIQSKEDDSPKVK